MVKTGFSDVIRLGDREILIETNFDEEQENIFSRVQDGSYTLATYQFPLDEKAEEEQIAREVEEKHRKVYAEWEHFFYVYGKVKRAKRAPSVNRMGVLLLKRNLFPEAIECFREALQLMPDYTEAAVNLGRAYIDSELYDEAIASLSGAIEQFPDYPDLHYFLGVAHLKRLEFQQAINAFEKALEINPKYDIAHFMLGKTYISSLAQVEDSEELLPGPLRQKRALVHLQRAVDLNPYFNQPGMRQAMKEIQNERFDLALEMLGRVQLVSPEESNHFDDEFYLEFMFGGKSKDDRLIRDYIEKLQQKIAENPSYPDLHNQLGVAYLIQCRNMFLKAMEQFRKALKLNPNFKAAAKNLKLAENEGKGFIILLRALLK